MGDLPAYLFEKTPWDKKEQCICLGYTLCLRRNISPFCFPIKMDPLQLEQSLQLIAQVFAERKDDVFYPAELLKPVDKELFFEYFLGEESFQNAFKGQGFILGAEGDFFAKLNMQDHLYLKQMGSSLEKSYASLMQQEALLGEKFPFSYNASFGYLTADPRLSGTALQAAAFMHLPALTYLKKVELLYQEQNNSQTVIEPLDASSIWVIRNSYTLGLSEEDILREVQSSCAFWVSAEEKAREQLKNSFEAKDAVSRAYGILAHAELVQTKEALSALGLLKWGADMGWIEGFTDRLFNEMFFGCQRARLSKLSSVDEGHVEQLAITRASLIRKMLAPTRLV